MRSLSATFLKLIILHFSCFVSFQFLRLLHLSVIKIMSKISICWKGRIIFTAEVRCIPKNYAWKFSSLQGSIFPFHLNPVLEVFSLHIKLQQRSCTRYFPHKSLQSATLVAPWLHVSLNTCLNMWPMDPPFQEGKLAALFCSMQNILNNLLKTWMNHDQKHLHVNLF